MFLSPEVTTIALLRETPAVEGSCLKIFVHFFSLLSQIFFFITYIITEALTILNCSGVEYVVHCSHRDTLRSCDQGGDISIYFSLKFYYKIKLSQFIYLCSNVLPSWLPCKSSPGGALCTGSQCNPRHSFQERMIFFIEFNM